MRFENICVTYDSCNGLEAYDNNTGIELKDFVSIDLKNMIEEASNEWDGAEKGSPEESAAENDYIKACGDVEEELEAIDFFVVVTTGVANQIEVIGQIDDQKILFISKSERDAKKFIGDLENEDKAIDDYQDGRYFIIF